MKNYVKISFCFMLFWGMVACCPRNPLPINERTVDAILFGSIPKGTETRQALSSVAMVTHSHCYKDSLYKNPVVIHRFISLVNQLSPAPKSKDVVDLRIIALVYIKDGSALQLGFGENWDTIYEGKRMQDSEMLFSFLDSLLYAPYPPDHWWDENTKERMRMIEMEH